MKLLFGKIRDHKYALTITEDLTKAKMIVADLNGNVTQNFEQSFNFSGDLPYSLTGIKRTMVGDARDNHDGKG